MSHVHNNLLFTIQLSSIRYLQSGYRSYAALCTVGADGVPTVRSTMATIDFRYCRTSENCTSRCAINQSVSAFRKKESSHFFVRFSLSQELVPDFPWRILLWTSRPSGRLHRLSFPSMFVAAVYALMFAALCRRD